MYVSHQNAVMTAMYRDFRLFHPQMHLDRPDGGLMMGWLECRARIRSIFRRRHTYVEQGRYRLVWLALAPGRRAELDWAGIPGPTKEF